MDDPECADRAAIIQRIGSVTSASVPRWGRMDAKRMSLASLSAVMLSGNFVDVRATGFFRYSQSSISSCMWCRSRKARRLRRSFCHQTPERWTHFELVSLVERIGQDRSKAWGRFTRYSAGSHSASGAWQHKHTDHHLRQFGA